MDELLQELYVMTKTTVSQLQNMSFEKLESFVESRQYLSDVIISKANENGPMGEEQKQFLAEILSYDNEILSRMQSLKLEAKDWLERNQQIKVQQNAYQKAYSVDSYYIDWKN
ncbi:hypothetical protein IM700_016525 [Paenibacillus sp. DXFW5]|uniref:Flagellar protein FliT n=1 Tax=Paenibacillus rhizolycopersici TaxID=2780073 RepID=A0ABS2H763_9BACL|nr:hypothetical protein [Paenibacillus rhizolycopersici]MBM6997267.1 hypothetical protein [Paenibacillus rhizolycopersici]